MKQASYRRRRGPAQDAGRATAPESESIGPSSRSGSTFPGVSIIPARSLPGGRRVSNARAEGGPDLVAVARTHARADRPESQGPSDGRLRSGQRRWFFQKAEPTPGTDPG